jgi:hypothetical protein
LDYTPSSLTTFPNTNLPGLGANGVIISNVATVTATQGHNFTGAVFPVTLGGGRNLQDFISLSLIYSGVGGDVANKTPRLYISGTPIIAAPLPAKFITATSNVDGNDTHIVTFLINDVSEFNGIDTVYFAFNLFADSGTTFNLANIRLNHTTSSIDVPINSIVGLNANLSQTIQAVTTTESYGSAGATFTLNTGGKRLEEFDSITIMYQGVGGPDFNHKDPRLYISSASFSGSMESAFHVAASTGHSTAGRHARVLTFPLDGITRSTADRWDTP